MRKRKSTDQGGSEAKKAKVEGNPYDELEKVSDSLDALKPSVYGMAELFKGMRDYILVKR